MTRIYRKNINKTHIKRSRGTEAGFGIVEIIVATFVFSLIVIIIATNFVDSLSLQRRGFAAQVMQEEVLFATEMMSREIRVSQIQSPDSNCSASSLTIDHPVSGEITYSVNGGIISKTVNGNMFPLTSAKIDFSRFNFCINGSGLDNKQSRVTLVATIEPTSGEDLRFDIQTTVSSRDLREELLN